MRRSSLLIFLLAAPLFVRAAPAELNVQLEQSPGSTADDKVKFALAALNEIGGAVRTTETLLEKAQKDKDKNTEEIECLQRKLTPMKGMQDVSSVSANSLQSYVAARDAVHTDQEYRKIAVALAKTRDFLAEAQACVGEVGARDSDNNVTMDDGGLGTDTTLDDDVPVEVVQASPN